MAVPYSFGLHTPKISAEIPPEFWSGQGGYFFITKKTKKMYSKTMKDRVDMATTSFNQRFYVSKKEQNEFVMIMTSPDQNVVPTDFQSKAMDKETLMRCLNNRSIS